MNNYHPKKYDRGLVVLDDRNGDILYCRTTLAIVDFDPDIITANLGSILGVLRIRWFVQKQATLVSESSFVEIVLIFASYEE